MSKPGMEGLSTRLEGSKDVAHPFGLLGMLVTDAVPRNQFWKSKKMITYLVIRTF